MKRFLLLLTLALCLPVSAQISKEEEDLMQAYGVTEEYLNMQRQMDSYLEQQEKNQQKAKIQLSFLVLV